MYGSLFCDSGGCDSGYQQICGSKEQGAFPSFSGEAILGKDGEAILGKDGFLSLENYVTMIRLV